MHPYYQTIKTFRKFLRPRTGVCEISCSVFDVPVFYLESMLHFINPASGLPIPYSSVADPFHESYATLFKSSSLAVSFGNVAGDTLSISKQWVQPTISPAVEPNYAAYYTGPSELPSIFDNPQLIIKRQEALLETTKTAPAIYDPFKRIRELRTWAVILCHGGSFSIGVFNRDKVVLHKGDKKYVSRAKAGKRQVSKDKKMGHINSIGSLVRRELEKEHQENIQKIMEECKDVLKEADLIFLHAPGINRCFFLSEGKPLSAYTEKIMPVLIPTKKANHSNVLDVFKKLTTVTLKINKKADK